jgi:hypothetical protein
MVVFPSHICPWNMVQLTLDRRYVPPQIVPKRTNPFFTVVRTIDRTLCRGLLTTFCFSRNDAFGRCKIRKGDFKMTKSVRLLLMGAALTGFTAGQNAFAQDTAKPDSTAKTDSGTKTSKAKVEKHACKGQNSCKGNGGCGATKGKNDCKGKGGCATDGSKMPKADAPAPAPAPK